MPLDEETKLRLDGLREDPLQQSLNQAVRMGAPDQNAKVLQYAQEQQLPVDTVQRNLPEVDARHHINQIDVETIKRDYPVLADYMRDPTNAAVSIDDLETLQEIESTLRDENIDFVSNTARGFVSRLNKVVGDLIEFRGTIDDAYRKASLPGYEFGPDGYSWYWDLPYRGPGVMSYVGNYISEGDAHRVGYKPNFTWENFKGEMTPTNLAGYVIEQGVQSLPDMAAVIYALPAYITSRGQGIGEERAANDGRRDADLGDVGNGMVVATAVALLERIGAKAVFDLAPVSTLREGATAVGEAVVKEGLTEFVQEGVEYYGETVGTRTEVSHDAALDRALAGMVAGSGFGGGIRASTATVEGITNRINRDTIRRSESMRGQMQLDSVIALAQSSKTNERAQDKFRQFLRGAGKERAVYVNAEDVINLVNSNKTIPDYIINEAMQNADGEIAIPLEDFALNTEMVEVLRPFVRFAPDQLNATELENYEVESTQDLIRRAAEQTDIRTQADEVYELVKDQLVSSGRASEVTAKWQSQIVQNYVTTTAMNTGLSPMEVYERMNFNIVGPRSVPPAPDAEVLSQAQENGYEGESRGEAVEWMRAVEKGLDMSTEARMERARAMGFDTDQVWYHGTESDFEGFESFSGLAGKGVYFSTQHTANVYGEQGSVIPIYISGEKATSQDVERVRRELGEGWNNDLINQQLNTEGFTYRDAKTPDIVVFDPSNIRSVNAAFDPDYADSPNLLAQGPTLQQAQRNNVGLYSQVENVVNTMRLPEWKKEDGTASGNVIWEKINKSDGVKQEELKWLGLEEYLKPYDGVDFRGFTVAAREDGKFEIRQPIDDFDYTRVEEVMETGEQVEITESARDYVRRLDKDINVLEKLLDCMKS